MHRLRDLDARDRALAVVLVLLLAAPFVASVAKAVHQGYTPTNDEALIALRVDDVLTGDLPLIGQPSTAEAYADVDPPHHPGPIEFYLLAPPVGLLGPDLGMLVGAGLFNLGAVLVAAWVAFRRAGPAVGLAAAVLVSTVAWSEGLAVLTDPISSNVGGIPLLALVALAWALLDGDLRLVPLAAFAFAFVCQQHLALVTISVGTAAWAAAGIALATVAWTRARGAAELAPAAASSGEGADEGEPTTRPPRAWPWLAGGLAVTLVAWSPVLVDQFWGDGNLGRMLEFARSSDRPTLGPRAGAVQALRAIGLPPMIARTDLTGHDLTAPLSPFAAGVAVLVAVALAAIVVLRWRTARTHATLAATTLVLALVGGLNGANVPDSVEAGRLNFYRWTFVVSIGMVLSLAWAGAALVAARRPVASPRLALAVRPAALVAVLAVAVGAIAVGGPQDRRDEELFRISRRLGAAGASAVEGRQTVLLLMHGQSANLSAGPAVGLDLVEAGHQVRVTEGLAAGWGDHMVLDEGERIDAVLLVATAKDVFDGPRPGKLLRREDLKAAIRPAIATLAEQLRRGPLVFSEQGDAIAEAQLPGSTADQRGLVRYAAAALADQPEAVLQITAVVKLLQHGYLTSPKLDPAALALLADSGNTLNWGEDVLEVRRLTVAEAEDLTGRSLRG